MWLNIGQILSDLVLVNLRNLTPLEFGESEKRTNIITGSFKPTIEKVK